MRADVALRAILLRLFDIMQANEEGVIANIDPEFLHDYRVAIRRTRSIIGRVRGVIPERARLQLRDELRWLGEITGPSRDMDVYMLNFSELKGLLVPSLREHLEPLYEYLQRHQKTAHDELVAQFKSERYRDVIDNWRQLLATMDFRKRPPDYASQPIIKVAGRSIWKCYKKVIRQGRAISNGSPPEMLHDLRKSCKKLRYLLEAFASLYSGKEMKWVVKQLKTLQDLLGEYQDIHVHSVTLRYFGQEMHKEMAIDSNTDEAIEHLGEGFDEKQEVLKNEVVRGFQEFAAASNYQRFHRLFKQVR
jgi:CHAD domain-containing protein